MPTASPDVGDKWPRVKTELRKRGYGSHSVATFFLFLERVIVTQRQSAGTPPGFAGYPSAHLAASGQSSGPEAGFSLGFQHLQISEQRRAQVECQLGVGGDDVGLLAAMFDDALTEKGREGERERA